MNNYLVETTQKMAFTSCELTKIADYFLLKKKNILDENLKEINEQIYLKIADVVNILTEEMLIIFKSDEFKNNH